MLMLMLMLDAPGRGCEFWEALDREVGETRKDRGQIVTHRELQPRQLSTTERMAAIVGAACGLPTSIQFLRPIATGRIDFSARLLASATAGSALGRAPPICLRITSSSGRDFS
jgi:hypothetical protein